MCEKCPNTELFLLHIFPHSDWIRTDTLSLTAFSPNAGKYGPEKTPYLDIFHTAIFCAPRSVTITSIQRVTETTSGARDMICIYKFPEVPRVGPWCSGYLYCTTLFSKALDIDFAQIQILLTACRRFTRMRISNNDLN